MREAARLRELEQDEQRALIAATSDLEKAEAADVAALAQSFRAGTTATPSTEQVEKARAAVRERERRVQGAREALTATEAELGVELGRSRESWQTATAKEADKVRQSCRDALDALRDGLERLAMLRGLALWLRADMNEAKPMRGRGLLVAPSSAHAQANSDPVSGDVLLQWASELIDPTARRPVEQATGGAAVTVR